MTITRERKPHYPGRKANRGGHACPCKRPDTGIWDFYRKYAGCGGINERQGRMPLSFFGNLQLSESGREFANKSH